MWIILTGVLLGLLFPMMLEPQDAAAQLMQGIPPSPIERLSGSTERIPQDFYIMPWIAAGVVYDSNVFFQQRSLAQDDVFLRVSPGLQASYQSTPLTVVANYRFDAEDYSKLHNLSSFFQRQFATLEFRGRPANNWTLNNTFGFAQTHTPYELNVLTLAQSARFKTERYFVNPSTEYRLDALTRIRGEYGYSHDIFNGGPEINSNIWTVNLDRRVGSHDWIGPYYVGRYFTFGGDFTGVPGFLGGNPDPVTSNALLLSWSHEFTTDTRLDVRAGPRMINGSLDDQPEAYVGLSRRFQGGEMSLAYVNALTTVLGTFGVATTNSIVLRAVYEPVRHLTFTLQPTAAWLTSSTFTTTVYTAYVEAAYQINKYMTAKGSAYFSYMDSDFVPTGETTSQTFIVPRNVYWLRLEFSYPTRWQ